jgi:hypothetical protein
VVAVARSAVLLAVMTAVLVAPASAGAAVLYDQTDNAGVATTNPADPNFSPSNDLGGGGGDRTADDFTVPTGQIWSIDEIDVGGAYSPTAPGQVVNVYIYSDASGAPGPELLNEAATATGGPNYAVPVTSAPLLAAGHYWLTVQQKFATTMSFWAWTTRTVQSGDAAHWVANVPVGQNCHQNDVWTVRTACWTGTNPDQDFVIKGTNTTPPPPPSNAISIGKPELNKKKGTAIEPVTVPGPGELTLSGAGVASQRPARPTRSMPVTGAGVVNLLVKPKGKTKKKLKKAGKAKAKLTITFTPTGGTANVQQKTVKLKKKLT